MNANSRWLPAIALLLGSVVANAQHYTVTDLGTLGGSNSYGYGINEIVQVAGYSNTAGNAATHAFLYSNATMHDLGAHGTGSSIGRSINASGQVAGYTATTGDAEDQAFLYRDCTMQNLGTLGGTNVFAGSIGYGINASGQITGASQNSDSQLHAFLYSNGHMTDLNSRISSGNAALYTLQIGQAINDRGQIVVNAVVNATGYARALLLTPTKKDSHSE